MGPAGRGCIRVAPVSSAPGMNVPGNQEAKIRGLLSSSRIFWPDAHPCPPTEIPENLEPRPHCPDGHSRSPESDTSICLTCTFPTLSQTHHMPHAQAKEGRQAGNCPPHNLGSSPRLQRPYVQPGQGPGDHPGSTLQQQLAPLLSRPGVVIMVSHQLHRWEIGGLFSAWCPWD